MQEREQWAKFLAPLGVEDMNFTRRRAERERRAEGNEQAAVERPQMHVELKIQPELCHVQPAQGPRPPFGSFFHIRLSELEAAQR